MFGLRLCGLDAWIERGPPQKDQAGCEGHQAAGQVGADPGCAPGHDDDVSSAQIQTGRIPEDRWGQVSLRGEDPSITMKHLDHGVSSVQSNAERLAKVGILLDFHRAKLDRWVFQRCAQKKSEHPFRQQSNGSFGLFSAMDQYHKFLNR